MTNKELKSIEEITIAEQGFDIGKVAYAMVRKPSVLKN